MGRKKIKQEEKHCEFEQKYIDFLMEMVKRYSMHMEEAKQDGASDAAIEHYYGTYKGILEHTIKAKKELQDYKIKNNIKDISSHGSKIKRNRLA